jgi:hypothetical protein
MQAGGQVTSRTVGLSDRDELVLGLLAAPGRPTEDAEALAEDLPGLLADRVTDTVSWRVPVRTDPAVADMSRGVEAIDFARARLLRDGWDMAVCITDASLRIGRRPVVADAIATHGVALISLPALGAVRFQPVLIDEPSVEETIEILNGLRDATRRCLTPGGPGTYVVPLATQTPPRRLGHPERQRDSGTGRGSRVRHRRHRCGREGQNGFPPSRPLNIQASPSGRPSGTRTWGGSRASTPPGGAGNRSLTKSTPSLRSGLRRPSVPQRNA